MYYTTYFQKKQDENQNKTTKVNKINSQNLVLRRKKSQIKIEFVIKHIINRSKKRKSLVDIDLKNQIRYNENISYDIYKVNVLTIKRRRKK